VLLPVLLLFLVGSLALLSTPDTSMAGIEPRLFPALLGVAAGDTGSGAPSGGGSGGCRGIGVDAVTVQEKTRDLGNRSDGRTDIPPVAFEAYCAAAAAFDVDWAVLAAIGWRECQHGRSELAGCNPRGTVNWAGARGPMQFLGSTWRGSAGTHDSDVAGPPVCFRPGERRPRDPDDGSTDGTDGNAAGEDGGAGDQGEGGGGNGDAPEPADPDPGSPEADGDAGGESDGVSCERGAGYATDGDGDGVADPWEWEDATYSAARMLRANRVNDDVDRALLAYNPSRDYVRQVKRVAREYREALGIGAPNGASLDGVAPPAGVTPRGGTELYRDGHNTPTMQKVLDAVITHFGRSLGVGCFRPADQDHGRGRACDVMMAPAGQRPTPAMRRHGQALADWLVANAEALGVHYVIWEQQIWNITKADEGWREMANRGGLTQNHYDHVHISVLR
jgi:hypothetical protein